MVMVAFYGYTLVQVDYFLKYSMPLDQNYNLNVRTFNTHVT